VGAGCPAVTVRAGLQDLRRRGGVRGAGGNERESAEGRRSGAYGRAPCESDYIRDVEQALAVMDGSSSSSDDDGSSTSSTHSASSSSSDSAPISPLPVPQSPPTTPPADARMEGVDAVGSDDEQLPPRVPVSGTEELFAFLLLRGQTTVAEGAYKIVRLFFNTKLARAACSAWHATPLPSLSTIRTKIAPRVRAAWALPIRRVQVRSSPATDPVPVDIILPSDHVKRDFMFRDTFDLFFMAGMRSAEERRWHPEFCDSRFCRDRADVLNAGPLVRAFTVDGLRLRNGDVVDISVEGGAAPRRLTIGSGSFAGRAAGVRADDSVHAGDFTFPCSEGGVEVGILNARHWLPARHGPISWHENGQPAVKVTGVARVTRANALPDEIGSELGHLPGRLYTGAVGLPTFSLLLAFFLDDFICRAGRSASAGGVYMLFLSWLFRHRTSRHAVRPIYLAAPGVNSDLVLDAITDDLVEGATVGWLVKDCDGRNMRVFADVALFIGDYKQVSKTGNLMGHMANAPCPLCTMTKRQGEGSRYAGEACSREIALTRTTRRTLDVVGAVRDVLQASGENSGLGAAMQHATGGDLVMSDDRVESDGSA